MSLINEALKKAQGERPVQGARTDAGHSPETQGHYVPPPRKNHKSLIWGFILAVFIVGTFSLGLSIYFISKLLDEEETAHVAPQAGIEVAGAVEEQETTEALSEPKAVEEIVETPPATMTEAVPEPEPVKVAEPARPATPPDPAVIARLMELEIRGIMSGGTRVLIYDQSSGRNKTYRAGDSLEGPMGLVVENISNSSIKFKDYAGQLHTKSF